jgi:Flp pilus assembly protein TadB
VEGWKGERGDAGWYERLARRVSGAVPVSEDFRLRENASASAEMRQALTFTGMAVEPYQIALLSYTIAGILAAALAPASVVLLLLAGVPLVPDGLFVLVGAMVAPMAALAWLGNYPKGVAARLKVRSLGRMPEAVNYMVMAMRNTPALDRAVAFSAENADEPVASGLRKVLWNVSLRRHTSIEESFLAFAQEWGAWNDDFKRSLFAVRAGTQERTHEGLQRSLDKAVDIVLSGTKRRMEGFAASLSGPTFVLFSLGILLPMMLGAMLPIASMGGLRLGTWETVALLDGVFPLATAAFAFNILGKRPGTSSPPRVESSIPLARRRAILAASCAAGAVLVPLGALQFSGALGPGSEGLGAILLLWGAALPPGIYLSLTTRAQRAESARIRRLEEELPDALFQLGSRVGEGMPVETAMLKTAKTMKGTEVAGLFQKLSFALRLTRSPLSEVLFGRKGILDGHPSRTVKASMRMVVESVRKDNLTAGQTIVGISQYLKDLQKLDAGIRLQLGSIMDTMRTTALFFAPLVMGITAALYVVLAGVTAGLGPGGSAPGLSTAIQQSIPAPAFTLIIGAYLLLTVVIIMAFTSGIRNGPDGAARRYEIGTALPAAMAVFTLATFAGRFLVG